MLFVWRESRAVQPMLPLSLFGHRLFALTSLVGLLVNIAIYGLIFVLSLYFQRINGLSAWWTGLAFVPMMGAVLPVNLLAPRLAERIGSCPTIVVGACISALGCLGLLWTEAGTSYWAIFAQMIAISGGLGLLVPPLTSTLLGSVDKARSGIAAGVLNATRQTGSVLGVALFGSLVASDRCVHDGPSPVAGRIGGRPAARRRRDRPRRMHLTQRARTLNASDQHSFRSPSPKQARSRLPTVHLCRFKCGSIGAGNVSSSLLSDRSARLAAGRTWRRGVPARQRGGDQPVSPGACDARLRSSRIVDRA